MLELLVRTRFNAWMFFSRVLVCCVGSSLCNELTTRSEESYRVCVCVCVCVCDLETSTMRRPRSDLVGWATVIIYASSKMPVANSCTLGPHHTYVRIWKEERMKNTKNVVVWNKISKIFMVGNRGGQIQGAKSPCSINFVPWRLILVDLQYWTCFPLPFCCL